MVLASPSARAPFINNLAALIVKTQSRRFVPSRLAGQESLNAKTPACPSSTVISAVRPTAQCPQSRIPPDRFCGIHGGPRHDVAQVMPRSIILDITFGIFDC